MDGKGISSVTVTFEPQGSTLGGICYGVTDAEGNYEAMVDDDNKGLAVGEYKVYCNKWVLPDGSAFVGEAGGPSPMEADAAEGIPQKYSDESMSTRFGVRPIWHQRLNSLSFGQRKRTSIVAALLGAPWLLLMDEPSNGLDPAGAEEIQRLLSEHRAAGKGAVITTNDKPFASAIIS